MRDELSDSGFLEAVRRQMVRFATLQLSDAALAEDVVQEALAGALVNARSFGRRAALKTWIFAILRHKIADALRQRHRERAREAPGRDFDAAGDEGDGPDIEAACFDDRGHWRAVHAPQPWGDPESQQAQEEFWRVFEACLDDLPASQARVFMMREFIGFESGEVCATVGISVSNLNVLLYRARLRLRKCLQQAWFSGASDRPTGRRVRAR